MTDIAAQPDLSGRIVNLGLDRSAVALATIADIERAWGWLERWGHDPCRIDLEDMDVFELMDYKAEVQLRVRVLAEGWSSWW